MNHLTDEQLVEHARTGDQAAFEALLTRLQPLTRWLARGFYAYGRDHHDLVQEAEIAVWRAVRTYDPSHGVTFRSLAALAIRRRLSSFVRLAAGHNQSPLNDSLRFEYTIDNGDPYGDILPDLRTLDPHRALELKEELATFVRVLTQELSPHQRRIVVAFLNDASYLEIAEKLGLKHSERPDGKVRSKPVDNAIQLVRRKLRRALDEAA